MLQKNLMCPNCKNNFTVNGNPGEKIFITCPKCNIKGVFTFPQEEIIYRTPSSSDVIETEKLTKKFGGLTAVNSLNLFIKEGEIYGLVGPNGSGKTTTIKMLCGLLHPTSGIVRILNQNFPRRHLMQEIGYMPQETAVYLDNTVHENLLLFGEIYGLKREEFIQKENSILKFVNLEDRRDEIVSNLSGGMKHRLSLACALIHEPRILFLDEPTVGVDPELRETFWKYFNIVSEKGKTILLTTHYMDEANHCSKVGFLRQGRLIAEGEPDLLKEKTNTDSLEDAFLTLAKEKN